MYPFQYGITDEIMKILNIYSNSSIYGTLKSSRLYAASGVSSLIIFFLFQTSLSFNSPLNTLLHPVYYQVQLMPAHLRHLLKRSGSMTSSTGSPHMRGSRARNKLAIITNGEFIQGESGHGSV